MTALPKDHGRYLVAELGVLVAELRNSRSSLTRVQLAALAERARDDATRLSGCEAAPSAAPSRAPVTPGGANVIPFAR